MLPGSVPARFNLNLREVQEALLEGSGQKLVVSCGYLAIGERLYCINRQLSARLRCQAGISRCVRRLVGDEGPRLQLASVD